MIKSTEFGKSRIDVYFRKERRMRHKSEGLMASIKDYVEKYYITNPTHLPQQRLLKRSGLPEVQPTSI